MFPFGERLRSLGRVSPRKRGAGIGWLQPAVIDLPPAHELAVFDCKHLKRSYCQWTAACPLVLIIARTLAPIKWSEYIEQVAWITVSCLTMVPSVIHDDALG
jgi:hypothetical protein